MKNSDFVIIGVSIILVIAFVILVMIPITSLEEKEGARPRDGITIGHSNFLTIDSMSMYVVTTRDPNLIELRLNVIPNTQTTENGMVGIYFPYKVELDRNHMAKLVNYTNWYEEEYQQGTAFVRYLPCENNPDCNYWINDQVKFYLEPEQTFDSINTYTHSVKLRFDNTVSKSRDFFERFEEYSKINFEIENVSKRQVTLIIDETAERIHTLPFPEPDMFHNEGLDYSNTQLHWKLTKSDHSFFVDYEMPDERQTFQTEQTKITAAGIAIGLSGIGLSIFARTKK